MAFGVLLHDMHIDRAATVAVALPSAIATFGAADSLIKATSHTHVERAAFPKQFTAASSTMHRIQPRDDDRRFIQNKKLYFDGGDKGIIWPSQ